MSGDHSGKERSDLNLYCGASSKPVPSITWTRVFENGSESQVLHTGTSWKIASINQTNAGKYRCTAYNGIGSPVSHTITVNVLCKYMYYVTQRAKKVVSDSLGLVDFATGLVIFVFNLPNGQVLLGGNSNYRTIVINRPNQKGCWG